MDVIEMIIDSSTKFYDEIKSDDNARYRSWEHCYLQFYKARTQNNVDIDYLCLQLAFYLASWGMYRGSSFLLQKDYKVHMPVVLELLNEKYNSLMGISCNDFNNQYNQKLLLEINIFLYDFYDGIRKKLKDKM